MFDRIVWWFKTAIEVLLLVRSVQGKFYRKYPVFYLYLGSVLLIELLSFFVSLTNPSSYQKFYWYTQSFSALVGYAVIVEIYRRALASYRGLARLANRVLLSILVAVATAFVVHGLSRGVWLLADTIAQSERNLHSIQLVLLVAIVVLLTYYAVPIGRNLKGIIFGYSFYVCASVISLAFGSEPGNVLRPEWRYVQSIAYFIVLLIWCSTLWSYLPNPQPKTDSAIERDYEFLARKTIRLLSRARAYLLGAFKP